MRGYRLCGVSNKTEIRFAIFIQGSRHTDNDGVHLRQGRKVRGRRKASCPRTLDLCGWNPIDVGSTGGESCDLALVDVKTSYLKLRFRVQQSQRQAHITKTDYADSCLASINSGFQF